MKKLLVATAALAILSPAAFAADAVIYEPVAQPAPERFVGYDWSGGYVGAHVGYGWGKTRDIDHPRPADSPEKELRGALGGIQAGYNWQFGNNIVFGAEADITFSGVKKNWDGSVISASSTYYTKDEIGTNGTIRARLGYAVDRFMPYVTGGVALANLKHTLGCWDKAQASFPPAWTPSSSCDSRATAPGKGPFEISKSKNVVGYTIGAGAEYAVDNNWSIKAEYLYKDFGSNKVTIVDPNFPTFHSVRNFKTSSNEVRIGVNYKF